MDPVHQGDPRTCPECGEFATSLRWLPPYRVEIRAHGSGLGDIAYFSNEPVVSARFRAAWHDAGLHGVESFDPLERLRIRPTRLGKQGAIYFHIEPRHFTARIDLARSHIEYRQQTSCSMCHGGSIERKQGYTIDESTWSGEDIFLAWGVHDIIVTDRVRKLRDDYGLTNVNLIPVEQYCWAPLKGWYIKGQEPDE